jgi:hypothetical protein
LVGVPARPLCSLPSAESDPSLLCGERWVVGPVVSLGMRFCEVGALVERLGRVPHDGLQIDGKRPHMPVRPLGRLGGMLCVLDYRRQPLHS